MKKQFKKSLSLFLAVLMMLSCWVWVAPQKAEAGLTGYTVTIIGNVGNAVDNESTITIKHTGNTSGQVFQFTDAKSDGALEQSFAVSGWPSEIKIHFTTNFMTEHNVTITKIKINEVVIFNDSYTISKGGLSNGTSDETLTYNGTWGSWNFTNHWKAPYFNEISEVTATNVETTKLTDGDPKTSTVTVTKGLDQYGVDWGSDIPGSGYTYKLRYTNASGVEVDLGETYGKISGTSNKVTATFYDDIQTLFPEKTAANVKVYATYNGKTSSTQIGLTLPKYDVTFGANGGKIGDNTNQADDTIGRTNVTYGDTIGKAPAYGTKTGYDLVGFYSQENADATGLTATFSGNEFVDGETKLLYDEGTKTINDKYYAAWKAKTITAKFMTADNQYIGEVEGRYGNYFTAENMYGDLAGLNAAVKASHTAGKVKFDSNNAPIYKDGSTVYTFAGWKIIKADDESLIDKDQNTVLTDSSVVFQAVYTKADATKYTVTFEDGAGNTASTLGGYLYRDPVTNVPADPTKTEDERYSYEFIGWAEKLEGVNFFAVDENGCDTDGVKIVYTSKDAASFFVKGNTTYIPVFRMIPLQYTVTYYYKADGNKTTATQVGGYFWEENPRMPEIKDNYTDNGSRYYIIGWTVGAETTVRKLDEIEVKGDMRLTAVYGEGIVAEYTINFYDKDGNLINEGSNIYEHNSTVQAPDIDKKIDTEDSLFTFVAFRDSNGKTYATTARADADYYAVYTQKDYADVRFYNYDGTLIYEFTGKDNGKFVGDVIPEYENIVDGVNVLPTKDEDFVGKYNFNGWVDSQGNTVIPGTTVFTGDIDLYAKFETVYTNYTVKFLNDDGTVVSEKKYHYEDEIEVPANATKAPDAEFSYEFRAWSPDVSKVCYGDATYTATYRRYYNYYKVTWLKDDKSYHSESNYRYGAIVQPALIEGDPITKGEAREGYTWVFDAWISCNANGQPLNADGVVVPEEHAQRFVRGTKMTGAVYFYAGYKEVADAITVTFCKEDGTEVADVKVPYDGLIADYADAVAKETAKEPSADNHYEIDKWVNVDTGAEVSIVRTAVSVKPVYKANKHTFNDVEVVKYPTGTEEGLVNLICTADGCSYVAMNSVVPVVDDNDAPTGQIYVGTDKWTLNDFGTINYSDVKFINPATKLIVNAEDIGTRSNPWNVEAKISRGVGKIDYFVSEEVIDEPDAIGVWTNIYDYAAVTENVLAKVLVEKGMTKDAYDKLNESAAGAKTKDAIDAEVAAIQAGYKANATGLVSNLNLEDGKEYIIYLRVSDRDPDGAGAATSNVAYFSTGKLSYGTKAPTITVSGEGYGAKYCGTATVTVADDTDGFTVYLDGEEVTLTDGKLTCGEGSHTVTAIDKNGNKSTKTIEVKKTHSNKTYLIAATCDKEGSRYSICSVCGAKSNEETIAARGHAYTNNYIDTAPTCLVDGYRTYSCDNNCGIKKVEYPEELKSTKEHTYAKVLDEDGNETAEDAWVIDKAATCKVAGSKHKDCTVCGVLGRVTEAIEADGVNGHKFYRATVTTEATCTAQGEKTKTCRYCGVKEHVEYIDMLGHSGSDNYRINVEPVCQAGGNKILTCDNCGVDIGDYIEISALGCAWKIDGGIQKVEDNVDGEIVTIYVQYYKCSRCGETKKEILENYVEPKEVVITFVNGDETVATIKKFEGESILASDVKAPAKADDKTYTYAFSHWEDADGKEVKFPMDVKAEATYKAVFTKKYINWTITYYIANANATGGVDTVEYKKTGYLHTGDTVTLSAGPSKAQTVKEKYEFAGWSTSIDGESVGKEVTVDGANISLYATYTTIKRQYAVTYAISSGNILESFLVYAGEPARDCRIVPTKNYDTKYHYTFSGWNKAAQLTSVESNIYTTPNFVAATHEYTESVKQDATCTSNAIILYTCDCGYSYEAESKDDDYKATGHVWSDAVFDETTGKFVKTCTNGCGATDSDNVKFTISYYKEGSESAYTHSHNVVWNTVLSKVLPSDPIKGQDAMYTYTFKGWAIKGSTDIIDATQIKVTSNMELVALFDKTIRTYKVTFAVDAHNVLKVYTVNAGSAVVYDGPEATKAYDNAKHYTFKGWSTSTDNILADTYVLAQFNEIAHTYSANNIITTPATCTNGQSQKKTCDGCEYNYTVSEMTSALGHNFTVEIAKKEAANGENGYIIHKCSRCDEQTTTVLYWKEEDVVKKVKVTLTVVNGNDNNAPIAGAKVALYKNSNFVVQDATTANGKVTLEVEAGKYVVLVSGVKYTADLQREITIKADGSADPSTLTMYTSNCSCACHRDNLWGKIFRFFHTIIAKFTGSFNCCKDPSELYG